MSTSGELVSVLFTSATTPPGRGLLAVPASLERRRARHVNQSRIHREAGAVGDDGIGGNRHRCADRLDHTAAHPVFNRITGLKDGYK